MVPYNRRPKFRHTNTAGALEGYCKHDHLTLQHPQLLQLVPPLPLQQQQPLPVVLLPTTQLPPLKERLVSKSLWGSHFPGVPLLGLQPTFLDIQLATLCIKFAARWMPILPKAQYAHP
eukprot:EG_transcript_46159